jgi:hypothetical protein
MKGGVIIFVPLYLVLLDIHLRYEYDGPTGSTF